ncbi:MAG: hypothetical protein AAGD04_03800 [Pseudomonadota bacterium]
MKNNLFAAVLGLGLCAGPIVSTAQDGPREPDIGPYTSTGMNKGVGFYGMGQLVDWNRAPPRPILIPANGYVAPKEAPKARMTTKAIAAPVMAKKVAMSPMGQKSELAAVDPTVAKLEAKAIVDMPQGFASEDIKFGNQKWRIHQHSAPSGMAYNVYERRGIWNKNFSQGQLDALLLQEEVATNCVFTPVLGKTINGGLTRAVVLKRC